MGKITHLPVKSDNVLNNSAPDIITLPDGKIKINGIEYEEMSLEELIEKHPISDEAQERFIKGLFQIIKEECQDNFQVMKIFHEIFKK